MPKLILKWKCNPDDYKPNCGCEPCEWEIVVPLEKYTKIMEILGYSKQETMDRISC